MSCQKFSHIQITGVDRGGAVDDTIHDGIGKDASAKTGMPVLKLVLGTENGRALIVAAFNQLKEKVELGLCGSLNQPLIKNQQRVVAVLLQQLGNAVLLCLGFLPPHEKVWDTDVAGTNTFLQ